jgi:hypothetical protein
MGGIFVPGVSGPESQERPSVFAYAHDRQKTRAGRGNAYHPENFALDFHGQEMRGEDISCTKDFSGNKAGKFGFKGNEVGIGELQSLGCLPVRKKG